MSTGNKPISRTEFERMLGVENSLQKSDEWGMGLTVFIQWLLDTPGGVVTMANQSDHCIVAVNDDGTDKKFRVDAAGVTRIG
jgi:hypothetical protein